MLNRKIESHKALINLIDEVIGEPEVSRTSRITQSLALLQLAMEHQKAIVMLVSSRLNGSASALMRPCTEAFVRGVWLFDGTTDQTDQAVEKFCAGQDVPKFGVLVQELEKIEIFSEKILSRSIQKNWKLLNGLTHGGVEQTSRRLTGHSIEPNFTDDELIQILGYSMFIGLNSAANICRIVGDKEAESKVFSSVQGVYPDAFIYEFSSNN